MGGVPDAYVDLFTRGLYAHLATVDADGHPHVRPVWVDYDGEHLLVNVDERSEPYAHVEANPRVAVSVIDPGDPNRHVAVRGEVVEKTVEGAVEHVKGLAERYLGDGAHAWQYDAPAAARRLLRIRPDAVTTQGYLKEQLPYEEE